MTDKQLKSMTIADLVKLAELLNLDIHFVIGNRPAEVKEESENATRKNISHMEQHDGALL